MELPTTYQSHRREQAADGRGLPPAYVRALKALTGPCVHCGQRAVISNGAGVGVCTHHRDVELDGRRRLERAKRQIEAAKTWQR